MAIRDDIPIETLRQLLRLDVDSGHLYWLVRPVAMFTDNPRISAATRCKQWNTRYAGFEAFTFIETRGYRLGTLFDRKYRAHQVVFALANSRWAIGDIDHRDGDKRNNRPENLREATRGQNLRNTGPRTGLYKGVSWCAARGKWAAYGQDPETKKSIYLGRFTDETDAARAYDAFARREHGAFARLNFP